MTEKNKSDNASSRKTITLSWLQMIIALAVVVCLSVACTVTVTMVINDNKQRATTSASYKKPETATTTPTSTSTRSERGYLVKHIGDKAAYTKSTTDRTELASWTATNITLDAPCQQVPDKYNNNGKPENGHFIAIDFTVQTTPQLKESSNGSIYLGSSGMWKYIEKDGTQWNGDPGSLSAINCIPKGKQLPSSIGPSVKAQGMMMFDLPSTDGYLVFDNGFEYPLG
ncbi:hypothetical protein Uis1B_1532 [Bifidobacterium margollesii]|uniref:DUF4352 domain-containing protein n=1 Tax=Bifidobacterium margollesii TaxID=2020964 RepID=A0A2N5J8S2_9BIFI|nr:hypothetical protein [Bifidobacterium margollesii]PLS30612.1 hypothetical protein Uis1B_1532 [Bifidobacterium margollesii]